MSKRYLRALLSLSIFCFISSRYEAAHGNDFSSLRERLAQTAVELKPGLLVYHSLWSTEYWNHWRTQYQVAEARNEKSEMLLQWIGGGIHPGLFSFKPITETDPPLASEVAKYYDDATVVSFEIGRWTDAANFLLFRLDSAEHQAVYQDWLRSNKDRENPFDEVYARYVRVSLTDKILHSHIKNIPWHGAFYHDLGIAGLNLFGEGPGSRRCLDIFHKDAISTVKFENVRLKWD